MKIRENGLMQPGSRIRMLRVILGISRDDFTHRHGINFNTFTSIEIDRIKVSDKQLEKIVSAFYVEGIQVSKTWLKNGTGSMPTRLLNHMQHNQRGDFIIQWARSFSHHRQSVMCQIKTDVMEPFYSVGDCVGGIWNSTPQILLGKRCVVKLGDALHVGTLFYSGGFFSLTPANDLYHYNHITFLEKNARFAEILWHIRKNSYQIPEIYSFDVLKKSPEYQHEI